MRQRTLIWLSEVVVPRKKVGVAVTDSRRVSRIDSTKVGTPDALHLLNAAKSRPMILAAL
jgi:hypothetical protein